MTTIEIPTPANILVLEGLTLPSAGPFVDDITAAAPGGSTITVVTSMAEAMDHASDVDVMLGIITKKFFAQTERLRWVHAIASGVDMFMFDEFINSDVVLTGEKGLVGGHLADTGWGLLLSLTRQIQTAIRLGPQAWSHRVDMRSKEIELEGMTMGQVGFGGTGRAIAKRAVAFGMRNIAVDVHPSPGDHGVDEVWGADRLDDLLAESDVVSVNLPLTRQTAGMFNDELFAKMKPGAIIMNVTRGEIIDGDSLIRALESGHLGGAALDVAPGEPLPADHPLFTFDNVAMTPHTAGASQLRAGKNVARFVSNLTAAQTGQPLDGVVHKTAGY